MHVTVCRGPVTQGESMGVFSFGEAEGEAHIIEVGDENDNKDTNHSHQGLVCMVLFTVVLCPVVLARNAFLLSFMLAINR